MKLEILSNEQLKKLHSSALSILEEVGVKVLKEETLEIFEKAGAIIDRKKKLAKIPHALVEESLKKAPRHFKLGAREKKHSLEVKRGLIYARPSTGFTKIIDFKSNTARYGICEDVANASKLIEDLENISINATHIFPSDVPHEIQDVYSFKLALENSGKHVVASPLSGNNLNFMSNIASIFEEEMDAEPPLFSALVCPISPLTLRDDVSILCAKKKIPAIVNSAPIVGVASPITLAGTMLLQSVESLATITLLQLINPGSPIIWGNKSTPLEMRFGTPLSGVVEIGLLSAMAIQVANFYGLPSEGFGTRTDSKTLDEQAGVERIFVSLLPALAGAVIDSGAGAIEAVATFSLEQLVIDDEIYGMIFRIVKGVNFNEETLAFKEIAKIGPGGSFLGEEHTRKFYLKEFYQHKLFDKRDRKDWEEAGCKDIRGEAYEKVKKMLAEHKPLPELSQKGKEEIKKILHKAEALIK
ncbi:MAG: trimethylamine methyltransferase family protein [Candidatus Bathyarchaeia archaeon]